MKFTKQQIIEIIKEEIADVLEGDLEKELEAQSAIQTKADVKIIEPAVQKLIGNLKSAADDKDDFERYKTLIITALADLGIEQT
jgi:hypothetical protein